MPKSLQENGKRDLDGMNWAGPKSDGWANWQRHFSSPNFGFNLRAQNQAQSLRWKRGLLMTDLLSNDCTDLYPEGLIQSSSFNPKIPFSTKQPKHLTIRSTR